MNDTTKAKGRVRKTNRRSVDVLLRREFTRYGSLYLMLIIPMAILILFKYFPMYGVQIAFRDYKITRAIEESKWVGFKYFTKFFNSFQFKSVLGNTLAINFYSLATFPLSLLFALIVHYMSFGKLKKTVQMISYAPHFISRVVMCSMIIQFLDARGGLINAFLELFGVEPTNWMSKPGYFYSIYVWSDVWQEIGYNSIIYVAALAGVSVELHEAAIVDGASIIKRIWHIDIPSVLPTFCILLVMRCGQLLNLGYEKVLLLQNNVNKDVSQVISTYSYEIGIAASKPQYSYAAAIGLFTSLTNLVLLVIVNRLTKKLSGSSLW